MAQYWPYYCEENVWWLASELGSRRGAALFISGAQGQVVMAAQRSGAAPKGLLCWDYHVVLLQHAADGWQVIDPDCTAPGAGSGLLLHDYARASFPPLTEAWAYCAPLFRAIEADVFVETFASDRRHMRDTDGQWLQPPPPWPCIGEGHTLNQLRDMSVADAGPVLSLSELLAQYRD